MVVEFEKWCLQEREKSCSLFIGWVEGKTILSSFIIDLLDSKAVYKKALSCSTAIPSKGLNFKLSFITIIIYILL